MLSAHGIVNQNVSRVSGMQNMLGNTELPETGAFDFLNYLLGLQVNSADIIQGQDALSTGSEKEAGSIESKDPLQTLFQKKEQPLWNPLIPVGGAGIHTPTLMNVKNKAGGFKESQLPVLSNASDKDLTAQSGKILENRLLEPKLFVESKERPTDVSSGESLHVDDMSEGVELQSKARSDIQKSKGIEKYNQQVDLKNQSMTHMENHNSLKTVNEMESDSRMNHAAVSESANETRLSEKKRGDDLSNSFVVLSPNSQALKISDGIAVEAGNNQVTEKVAIPEVFKRVESMVHHGGGKMTVELSPPELGKLEVDVVTKGNHVEIKMRSDNDIAKVTLESHMGELKNAMEGQSLTLHKVEVQVGLSNGHSFQERQFNAFMGNEQGGTNRQFSHRSQNSPIPTYKPEMNLRAVSSLTGANSSGGIDLRI